jgi:peptidyl-prolyl cis-trans isomerase C
MNRFTKLLSTSLLLLCLLASAAVATEAKTESVPENEAAPAAEQTAPDPEKVLATVGASEIRLKDIREIISRLDPQRAMMYDNEMGHRAILEEMVNMELFYLLGLDLGLEKDPQFIRTMEGVRKDVMRQFAVEALLRDVTVSGAEIADYYEKNKESFKVPETVRARHILVADDEAMKKVREDLATGMSFEDAAKKHSSCPSKDQGGDLGYFAKEQMVPEFAEAAFSMKVGEISAEPVKTNFGLHLINLVDKKEASVRSLGEVREELAESLLNDKKAQIYRDELVKLREKHTVVITGEPEEKK